VWRQLGAYEVTRQDDRVTRLERDGDRFRVTCESGAEHVARALVLAGGQRYRMPAAPGVQERLGSRVFHCPFCHGYEVGGQRLALIASAEAAGFVDMLRLWSDDVTFVDAATPGLTLDELGDGDLRLADGDDLDLRVDAVFAHPHLEPVDDLPEQLGLERAESPMSRVPAIVATTGMPPGATSEPGVFVAGDLASIPPSVAGAIASGTMAGGSAAHYLAQQFAMTRT
jgi:thioredoxin reductase